ncbi:MAG: NifU family protein [Phycisphaerales bacterium]|nr:NifU family protein [Phycisphaerales bacterium]
MSDLTGARPPTPVASLHERVQRIIDLIRPAVQSDGGDLELVEVTPDGVVQVRFHGACVGCPSSTMTLQVGIERNLRERVPEVTRVEAVT